MAFVVLQAARRNQRRCAGLAARAAMGDLFDDPDVAGVLAHCSGDWGTGELSFHDGSPEEASFFDASNALPTLAYAPHAPQPGPLPSPRSPGGHLAGGVPHAPVASLLPSALPLPPLPAAPAGCRTLPLAPAELCSQ